MPPKFPASGPKSKPSSKAGWMGTPATTGAHAAAGGKLKPTKLPSTPFVPRSQSQADAMAILDGHDLTFLIGPAGSAKTCMAAAQALIDMKSGRAEKIIITRATVEAGESIGFLPGPVREKMELYVRPILDALELFLPKHVIETMLDQGLIEMIPITYLRGKSIANAVIIIDEFQNATPKQAKLCLTRAGEHTRILVTCDPDQVDLADNIPSAVEDLWMFEDTQGIAFVELTAADVTRSALCRKVLMCYDKGRSDTRAA